MYGTTTILYDTISDKHQTGSFLQSIVMDVYGLHIPDKPLTNFELLDYAKQLNIPNFRGVFMSDELPRKPWSVECGIVNFNTSLETGSHWVAYYKNKKERIAFDSYGQVVLAELRDYLKTEKEKNEEVIQRNTDIVQKSNTQVCGHLCLYVLKSLSIGQTFREILDYLTTRRTGGGGRGAGIQWTNNIANELHKTARKNFLKRFVFVRHVDDVWGADLVELQTLSRKNSGYRYILMVIDIFSKYGWSVPLKTKTGKEVAGALQKIFKENKSPAKLWVDKGREFYNKDVSALLKKNDILIYSTNNDEKCSVVERWNRTIKTQLWRYFSANGTHKYIDILQPLMDKYNSTKHRSIGMTPLDARKSSNYQQVFKNLYFKKVQSRILKPKYKVGDKVRISKKKNIFEKGFTVNWSDKIYTITEILKTLPPTYKIKDDREEIKGTFYEQELQKTSEDTFRIEKVLRWKKQNDGGERLARVKWVGYDSSYNSWVPETSITNYGDH